MQIVVWNSRGRGQHEYLLTYSFKHILQMLIARKYPPIVLATDLHHNVHYSHISPFSHSTPGTYSFHKSFPPSAGLPSRQTICRSWNDLTSLLILLFFFLLCDHLQKSRMLRRFNSDRDEIWQKCFLSKYASIDGVGFSLWLYTFKMAAMTLFHTQKCCHLLSTHDASAQRISSSVH